MTREGGEEMSNYSTDYERGIPNLPPCLLSSQWTGIFDQPRIRHCVPSKHPWALKIYLTIMGTYRARIQIHQQMYLYEIYMNKFMFISKILRLLMCKLLYLNLVYGCLPGILWSLTRGSGGGGEAHLRPLGTHSHLQLRVIAG